jgi:hypothetical protein
MRGVFLANHATTDAGKAVLKWAKQNKDRPTPPDRGSKAAASTSTAAQGTRRKGETEKADIGGEKRTYVCTRGGCTFGTTTTAKEGNRRCPCAGYTPSDQRPRKHSHWSLQGSANVKVEKDEGEKQAGDEEEEVEMMVKMVKQTVYKCARNGCAFGTTTTNKAGSRRCSCAGYTPSDQRPRKHKDWVPLNGSVKGEEGEEDDTEGGEEDDAWREENIDHCSICFAESNRQQQLYCCEGCPAAFHAACLPDEDFDQVDLWACPDCRKAFRAIEKGSPERRSKMRQRRAFLRINGWRLEMSSTRGHYRYTSPDKTFHTGTSTRGKFDGGDR